MPKVAEKLVPQAFRFPEELAHDLRRVARLENLTYTEFVVRAVRRAIAESRKNMPKTIASLLSQPSGESDRSP